MILIDNRNYLRLRNRPLLEMLAEREEHIEAAVIEPSKRGLPTLKLTVDEKTQYVYSKYDPEKEVERLHKQKEIPENTKHVLFFGAGLGYQIQALLNEYPDMNYSIYEPNQDALVQFFSHQNINDLCGEQLHKVFTTTDNEQIRSHIQNLYQLAGSDIYIYTLPVYEKLYAEELKIVMETMKELLQNKRGNLAAEVSFQKRWTINSIKNFPKVMQTPNILHDVDRSAFEGKAAIIVAAGPSLSEEFENLRYIKEHGLAYIFSVGSAINSLIEHDIYPDAACTYDPKERNQNVIKIIKDRNITGIPLVFGSSVGFETLLDYPGPMLHMITSQDTIAPSLVKEIKSSDIVHDAPSIAVVVFELLNLMGFNQIILVGQNLGFKNNMRFANGIKYSHITNELTEEEKKDLITVKDVNGMEMYTSSMYFSMKKQLEMHINRFNYTEVVNTTKGGAHIEGTTFMSLTDVIVNGLSKRSSPVVSNWWRAHNQYDYEGVQKQKELLEREREICKVLIKGTLSFVKKMEKEINVYQMNQLSRSIKQFDNEFNKLQQNLFFKMFIEPMMRVQIQQLRKKSKEIHFERNIKKKGKFVIQIFGPFLIDCYRHFEFVETYYRELITFINKKDTVKLFD